MADPVEEIAGRLYGLPLEEFTRERDAAARELRKAKERDAAAVVAKLPKPTQAAWAANALAREHRDLVDDLFETADALREAQEAAVAGKGADALREAAAEERAAVEALMGVARDLEPGGRKASAATLEKLKTTLEAVATDDAVRAALEAGRVVEDAEGGGAWGLLSGADVPAPKPRAKKRPAKKKAADDGEAREREAAIAAAREARSQLETDLREARAERRSRERELERAEKTAERTAGRLEQALAAAEEAREHAEEAKSELEAAREAASEARDTVARLEEQLD
ncbi:MAG TPA: hypothetical protein VNO82_19770 [Solirubrobacteraceae bacterium]|nr:hypothetical protein [Solirubrobacteraceae bacterium]